MKKWSIQKEIFVHLGVVILLFTTVVFLQGMFDRDLLLTFIAGGLIGTFLPDLDHLIYALYLKPNELTSQRVRGKIANKNFMEAVRLLFRTTQERSGLIFHTAFFQCLFVVFALLIVTSSSSVLGRGIVLAFLTSLLVDQLVDLSHNENVSHWFRWLPVTLTSSQFQIYVFVQGLLILLLSYLF